MTEAIRLSAYDRDWPHRFRAEADNLMVALGESCVRIHHVGSTAVPGLAAKPIIDIALECAVFPPTSAIIKAMEASGYEHMGECGVPNRHWFRKGTPRAFHVHVVPENGDVALRQIAFRDFLRKHPDARRQYEVLKRKAARSRDIDSAEYALARGLFIEKSLCQQTHAPDTLPRAGDAFGSRSRHSWGA